MKKLLILGLAFALPALAQIKIAPNGSASAAPKPPIGIKKSGGNCSDGSCLEFIVKPYCFGTNLRAYDASTQMKENEDIKVKFNMVNLADSGKKDEITVQYPAKLTFASDGVRSDCEIVGGSGATKQIACTDPKPLFLWKFIDYIFV